MVLTVSILALSLGRTVLTPVFTTDPVPHDADDPAIWVARDGSKALIIGTDKQEQTGGLYVFDLKGHIVQSVTGLDRPNNVDVEYGFKLDGKVVDLAVVTERGKKRLRIFAIERKSGHLRDVTGNTGVFLNRSGPDAVPMGVSLTEQFIAVVSPKSGPTRNYLGSYRLVAKRGRVDTVRHFYFGVFSGSGEIESVCVDDDFQAIYYSDESAGIRRTGGFWQGRPRSGVFGESDFLGDREGIAVHSRYVVSCDQIEDRSRLHIYERTSANRPLCVIETMADETDGIEATSRRLGARFPQGILVMMNSQGKNFQVYDWRDVEKAIRTAPRS